MSTCLVCNKEITDGEYMVNGKAAVCAWTPPGAGKSVYAIVSAHLNCMTVDQLQQMRKCCEDEASKRGYPSLIFYEVERRLSHLLAGGARGSAPSGVNDGSRFSWLEVDE